MRDHVEVFWERLAQDLHITTAGLTMLKTFDYFIVMQGYRAWSLERPAGCPVKAIAKNCHNLCKEKGIKVEWSNYYKKLKSLNLDQNSPLTTQDQSPSQIKIGQPPKYNGNAKPAAIKKALDFLGDALSPEIKEQMAQWAQNHDSEL